MCSRVEPVTVAELFSQLLSFETRLNLRGGGSQSSANAATQGRINGAGGGDHGRRQGGNGGDRGGRGGGYSKSGGRGSGHGNNSSGGNYNNNHAPRVQCQICGKMGHPAWKCWKRYDESYQGVKEKSANLAAPQYGVDTNWYLDSGATDHITGDLEKLTMRDRYTGNEQIHTASGPGMGNEEGAPSRQG
ncbi:rRNA 2'-O-methyltransferase fibrillarin-like [Triticum aestivum]|uniref:rRNA 2'-O-methyltransferase fibrillarin-like n=1 Tax=Triticum aestivum TaxID=4565 RepID=UPI001D024E06|nr:rRNA 2'-O-methyltransferase fibrillarin-like [Triticum aestivum]